MKKHTVMFTVALLALIAFASGAMAATENSNIGATSKRGSLLIFPKISAAVNLSPVLNFPAFQEDTLVSIGNFGTDDVTVECVWKFPKITTGTAVDPSIAPDDNPSYSGNYWFYKQDCCGATNFTFDLSAGDVYYFSAGTGFANLLEKGLTFESIGRMPSEAKGNAALTCFAIKKKHDNETDSDKYPISYNQLYGDATIITLPISDGFNVDPRLLVNGPTAWKYSAWAFRARSDTMAKVGVANPDGTRSLPLTAGKYGTGTYDACPNKLTFNFWPQIKLAENSGNSGDPASVFRPDQALPIFGTNLNLYPCTQNFAESGPSANETIALARFKIWSPNENQFSSTYTCIKCWFEQVLGTTNNKGRSYENKLYDVDGNLLGYKYADVIARTDPNFDFATQNNKYRFPKPLDAFNIDNAENLDFFLTTGNLLGIYGRAEVDVTTSTATDADPALFPFCTAAKRIDTGLIGVAYNFIDVIGGTIPGDEADVVWLQDIFGANPDGVPEINPGTNVTGTGIQGTDSIKWDPNA